MKPAGVRHQGVKGIVQTGDSIDPAPAIATGQGCEPSVERPLIFFSSGLLCDVFYLKMLNIDSHKRRERLSTGQVKHIRGLDFSAIEERGVECYGPLSMLHDLGKVCVLLHEPKQVAYMSSKCLLAWTL